VILDDGGRQGLAPIGMTGAAQNTSPSDTERRTFPGLATKSSVFAWTADFPSLLSRAFTTGTVTDTINLRNNASGFGASVDVPSWAAGCVVSFNTFVAGLGTSTFWNWALYGPFNTSTSPVFTHEMQAKTLGLLGDTSVVIVPFFDEPTMTVSYSTNGTGTGTWSVTLLGFVRNV
jgi:hypothetical protein